MNTMNITEKDGSKIAPWELFRAFVSGLNFGMVVTLVTALVYYIFN